MISTFENLILDQLQHSPWFWQLESRRRRRKKEIEYPSDFTFIQWNGISLNSLPFAAPFTSLDSVLNKFTMVYMLNKYSSCMLHWTTHPFKWFKVSCHLDSMKQKNVNPVDYAIEISNGCHFDPSVAFHSMSNQKKQANSQRKKRKKKQLY